MPNKIEIGKLISGEIKPKQLNEIKENHNKIQRGLAREQKNNKIKYPQAPGETMRERYEGR